MTSTIRTRIDPTGSLTPPQLGKITAHNWRHVRARAHHIAREHRRYLHAYGRLPHCPLHLLETEPLWQYLRATETDRDPAWATTDGDQYALTPTYIARRCGLSPDSVRGFRERGHLTRQTAERIADRLGVHPLNIWPDYHFDLGTLDDESEAA